MYPRQQMNLVSMCMWIESLGSELSSLFVNVSMAVDRQVSTMDTLTNKPDSSEPKDSIHMHIETKFICCLVIACVK